MYVCGCVCRCTRLWIGFQLIRINYVAKLFTFRLIALKRNSRKPLARGRLEFVRSPTAGGEARRHNNCKNDGPPYRFN